MTDPHEPPATGTPGHRTTTLDRRQFLRAAALLGVALAAEACGSPIVSATPSPGATVRPTGPTPAPTPPPATPASGGPGPAPSPVRRADNPVQGENRRAGDPGWDDPRRTAGVEAYLGSASIAPGEQLRLRASGTGTVDVEVYRLGWYDGSGGRLVSTSRGVKLAKQPGAAMDPQTGMVEAGWPTVLDIEVPRDCPSGMLLAVVRAADGSSVANAPVVLRPDGASRVPAPVLFVSAGATWQAYNGWGGVSLYDARGGRRIAVTKGLRGAVVSFDRPYQLDGGAMYLRRWELQFVRWMERDGRDVEYVADVDLELSPSLADGRRMIVMAGHPEYWTRPMRATLERAVASGTNVAFLTANEIYWSTRLEPGPTGAAGRLVCYKSAALDPMTATDPSLTTCRWREAPLRSPEAPLVGQMYGHPVRRPADWVVAAPAHWLYEGTGLASGDRLTNLVGQEYDTIFPDLAPAGTLVLARGPVDAEIRSAHDPGAFVSPSVHTSTVYTAASGATVLAAGTFQWSWAIDRYGSRDYRGSRTPYDERVVRMTRNLFDRLGDGPLAP